MRKSPLSAVVTVLLGLSLLAGCATSTAPGSMSDLFFSDMVTLRDTASARVSSFDRSGNNIDFRNIPPGETLELANLDGAGCIRHLYFTIGGPEHYPRELVLRMYWDGEATPSVETPFGDFFGVGQERARFFRSLLVTVNPGANGIDGTVGFNSYFPMPFAKGARLTLTNEGAETVGAVWYHVDYEKLPRLDKHAGRFHAQWHRENPTEAVGEHKNMTIHDAVNTDGRENYVILDAQGRGNLAGYFLNVDNIAGGWYGEGDDMIFIDGEPWPPSFYGTGTEEIFGGGACPDVEYAGPYTGFHLAGNRDFSGKTSMYRFFVTDPIRFQRSIRVTIEHGHADNFSNDYSSTVFWYQAEPHAPFPALLPVADRIPRAGTDVHDAGFLKHRQVWAKSARAVALAREQEIAVDPADEAALNAGLAAMKKALEAGDYATVNKICDDMLPKLDAFIQAHEK